MAVIDRAWVTAVRFLVLFAVTVEWRMNLGAAWSLGDEVGCHAFSICTCDFDV